MIPVTALIATLLVQSTQAAQAPTFVEKIPEALSEFKMIKVPDGEITVDGKPVKIENLYVGETEVTWDVYDIFAFSKDLTDDQVAEGVDKKNRPSRPYGKYDRGFGHAGFPAIGMTHHSAEQYCAWLSKKTGKTYRLPTEAEWIYMASAAGTQPPDLDKVAWYAGNVDRGTRAVKQKEPNAWGFYDVLGNASEWVAKEGEVPVAKGGSWLDEADKLTFASQDPFSPMWQERDAQIPKSNWWLSDGPFVGLRVVCEVK